MTITVVTPSTPPRVAAGMLARNIASVAAQTIKPEAHIIAVDHQGQGEAVTRNQGLFAADTDWVAFLDDDDTMYPFHLEALLGHAKLTGADLVYPWFDIEPRYPDPLGWEGKEFDGDALRQNNYVPVTHLVRRALAQEVGGFPLPNSEEWPHSSCVDWGYLLRLLDAGATFSHLDRRTWAWHWHGRNYSGQVWTGEPR
jgi:glycosyltransferase involved in cell wall biosynthesis